MTVTLPAADNSADSLLSQASALMAQGNFDGAVPLLRSSLEKSKEDHDVATELKASVGLADALHQLGQNRLAEDLLEKADQLVKPRSDKATQALIESNLGAIYMLSTNPDDAEGLLTKSLALAKETGNHTLIATVLNNLANYHKYKKNYDLALDEYQKAVSSALDGGNKPLALKIEANLIATAVEAQAWDKADAWADKVVNLSTSVPDTHEKAMALIGAGRALLARFLIDEDDDELRLRAFHAYQQAQQTASNIQDNRALSYALGYQGELYELEGKTSDALELTRHASILAEQIKCPDILFRWQWQIARILNLQHQLEPAISAYQSAVATLQSVRHDLSLHYGNINYHSSFRDAAGSLYYELADLLLQRADKAPSDAENQADLFAARDTVEELKSAELEDYFQDDCANLLRARTAKIETLSTTAAIVYIIPLENRTEILVGMPSGRIERVQSKATAAQLEDTATAFRFNLEKRTTDEYLAQGQQLYDWLIKPLGSLIDPQKIDTLVFVPDGALRTIPMAALYDGEHFLIEKYAIAITPGLTLMEPKPIGLVRHNLVINGLSEGVQGYAALPYVPEEVNKIESIYNAPELLNGQFNKPNVQKEFAADSYSIVHIASHGHFDSDARKTFILTYDGKLSLDDMERMIRPSQLRDQPVEMLTLSACQTAAGDDRAALGLAGIAVKAGARSAFATLWFVNDQASSLIIGDFYTHLHATGGMTKAKALQLSQIKLLSDPRYGHPCYWAPYMIIGNWL